MSDEKKYYALTDDEFNTVRTMIELFTSFVQDNYADLIKVRDSLREGPADVMPDEREVVYAADVNLLVENMETLTSVDLDYHISTNDIDQFSVLNQVRQDGVDPEGNGTFTVQYLSDLDNDYEVEVMGDCYFTIHNVEYRLPTGMDMHGREAVELLREAIETEHPELEHVDFSIEDWQAIEVKKVAKEEESEAPAAE